MHDIVMQAIEPLVEKYHNVYTDRAYTSIQACELLLRKNTYMTGSIRNNIKDLPKQVKSSHIRKIKTLAVPRGTTHSYQKDQLTTVVWKDNKVMFLLSSGHNIEAQPQDNVLRRMQLARNQRWTQQHVPAPRHAVSFQQNMGGVDRHDQLRSYHTVLCQEVPGLVEKIAVFFDRCCLGECVHLL